MLLGQLLLTLNKDQRNARSGPLRGGGQVQYIVQQLHLEALVPIDHFLDLNHLTSVPIQQDFGGARYRQHPMQRSDVTAQQRPMNRQSNKAFCLDGERGTRNKASKLGEERLPNALSLKGNKRAQHVAFQRIVACDDPGRPLE